MNLRCRQRKILVSEPCLTSREEKVRKGGEGERGGRSMGKRIETARGKEEAGKLMFAVVLDVGLPLHLHQWWCWKLQEKTRDRVRR